MTSRLKNKNAIITGSAAGIGFETAKLFGQEGANVTIMDISEEAANKAAEKLIKEGIIAKAYALDVTDYNAVQTQFKQAIEHYQGKIDILVNNAGIADFGSVDNTEPNLWQRVMAVNIDGTYFCSKVVLPTMLEQGSGTIINCGSVAGTVGIPGMAAYCAAKAAIMGLTKQMSADYSGKGIRVNCVCPGTVATTAMGQQLLGSDTSAATQKKRLSKYPIGRFGEPKEIANGYLFLASDESSFVCGSSLYINGGMTTI